MSITKRSKYGVIISIKQIQPFNYNTDAIYAWFIGIIIIFISVYVAFVKIKEKSINKVQMIVLFTILFFIIGLLGELIPPFTKTTTSPITKDQYEHYKEKKLDWSPIRPLKPTIRPLKPTK